MCFLQLQHFYFAFLPFLFMSLWHERNLRLNNTAVGYSVGCCSKRRISQLVFACTQVTFILVYCFVFIPQGYHKEKKRPISKPKHTLQSNLSYKFFAGGHLCSLTAVEKTGDIFIKYVLAKSERIKNTHGWNKRKTNKTVWLIPNAMWLQKIEAFIHGNVHITFYCFCPFQ